jgi:hypothetical protein
MSRLPRTRKQSARNLHDFSMESACFGDSRVPICAPRLREWPVAAKRTEQEKQYATSY